MENQVKSSNAALWVVVVILAAIVAGILVFMFQHENKRNALKQQLEVAMQDSVTSEYVAPTVDDIVYYREQLRRDKYLDSVYINMPEVALRAILQEYGTDISGFDIAEAYLRNPEKYKNIKQGADIQTEIIKKQENVTLQDSTKSD